MKKELEDQSLVQTIFPSEMVKFIRTNGFIIQYIKDITKTWKRELNVENQVLTSFCDLC